jgi:hypothetical protein
MSQTSKTVLWIVLIVVVIGLIAWLYSSQHLSQTAGNYPNIASASDTSLTRGNSNSDLNQDMTKVDAQMNYFNQDYASANQ